MNMKAWLLLAGLFVIMSLWILGLTLSIYRVKYRVYSVDKKLMGRRKIQNRNIRKLAKVGGGTSYSVTIPMEAIRSFGWREAQKVVIEIDRRGKRIIIKDWKK